ncbi:nuclear fragile X mental retardation-interacting protein 1-domain-containing protein [Trametes gibbosa]|nr:nuclear fragile X mental retardation-interacting protein 1-domain-containing protein [Trametes gibbosa]
MQPHRPQQPPYDYATYPHTANNTVRAAQAVATALANPYGHTYGRQLAYAQPSHYAQAYAQYYGGAGPSQVTADGYTISSTYLPGTQYNVPQQARPAPQRPQAHSGGGGGQGPPGWYQPGTCRCTTPGCSFTGSKKTVDVHMMDRHLIYPPGWQHRKRNDWDADPSLKGKSIPIQGTSIKLDTPEAIEQWKAERKKRFPTAQSVEDKQRKMREAIERGQLPFDDASRLQSTMPSQVTRRDDTLSGGSSDSESDGAPEVISSKGPVAASGLPDKVMMDIEDEQLEERGAVTLVASAEAGHCPQPVKKIRPKQPRRPLYNPFAQRPSLLRNLLLPEIRMTVSNLSQAIHFLVDNDFLDNVELKPGQASERMIEVVGGYAAAAGPTVPTQPTRADTLVSLSSSSES